MKNCHTISNLSVEYFNTASQKNSRVLDNVSFECHSNQITVIVGESGAGKTTLAKAMCNLLPGNAKINSGILSNNSITYDLTDSKASKNIHAVMVYQDPFAALNPRLRIKKQFDLCTHSKNSLGNAIKLLEEVGISPSVDVLEKFSAELSGGLNQRVCIALALSTNPELLFLDEPTSAIDSNNISILASLIKKITYERQISTVIITHDIEFARQIADKIIIMKDGKIVENSLPQDEGFIFKNEYSKILFGASEFHITKHNLSKEILVKIENISKSFKKHQVLNHFSMDVYQGEVLGLFGKSGKGKSTLAKIIIGLYKYDSGNLYIKDNLKIEYLFQNIYASLNPRLKVRQILTEAQKIKREKALQDFELHKCCAFFSLPPDILDRKIDQLSGGQRQMVAIMRSLISNPDLIIFDEPTSSLDAVNRSTFLDLIDKLIKNLSITIIVITHDEDLLNRISNRIIEI